MRLTAVIIFLAAVQVSASSFGQKVTYLKKDVALVKLFKEIKKQTGYNVVWYEETLDASKIISARFKDASIEEVMGKALSGMQLAYTISKNTIVIKEKERSFLDKISDAIHSIVKDIDVRGKITDEYNKPLKGATVKIKGTQRSVITDENGNFYFENVKEKAVLVISYLGYKSMEIEAAQNLNGIQLMEGMGELAEVQINAGYYSVKETERTGSISKITSNTIEKQPVNNPLMALQGRVPGLQITQQTGIPGGGLIVQIRGRNSLFSGNDPLYIVDGVNYPSTKISSGIGPLTGSRELSPLSMINPSDIESIEILKDADATAIYGSRGANGVVLITTKKGKMGMIKVNAGISQGFSQVGHYVNLLNTQEYIQMRTEAFKNDKLAPGLTDYDINGTWDQHKYTDWQKELIGNNAKITNASLDISGGTIKSTYIIGASYYKEGTVFPGDFGLKRIGIRSIINLGSAEDRFSATFTANFNNSQSNLFSTDLTNYILLAPNQPNSYDEFGKLTWSNNTIMINPMANLLQTFDSKSDNLIGNFTMKYEIIKNLDIKTTLGYSSIKIQELQKNPLESINPALPSYVPANRSSLFGNNYNNNLIFEPMITYKRKIGRGIVDILLGMNLQNNSSQQSSIRARNFTSDNLLENIGSAGNITSNGTMSSQYRYAATFARVNYNISDRYFLNLTARRDGSSRFGPGKQFANFGAIGSGWIFSEEKIIKEKLPFLNFGKLRASYGVTGNDQIQDYGYLQLWDTYYNTYQGNPTITPNSTASNADFAWETNRKLEAAIQLGFLKDKINLEFSFYRNRSSNQLLPQSLPLSTGLFYVQRNLPAQIQNTGWELDANVKIVNLNDFQWSTGFNLTIPKNKLLSYPGLLTSGLDINYQIGEPLSILKTYNVTVDKQTGLYSIEDKNNSGTIDDADRYLVKFLGQFYYGGLRNSIKYKDISFDFLFSFVKQNGRSYRTASLTVPGRGLVFSPNSQFSEVLERWQKPGDETLIQRYGTTSLTSSIYSSVKNYGDLSVVDASYVRLKNISLSYSFPKNLLSKLKISNATISLRAQNVFTITNYIGLDPETQSFNLPPLRTIMFGLNFTL